MKKQKVIISVMVLLICFGTVAYFSGWLDTFLGRKFVISEINLELIRCPAGSFMMGSPKEELGRFDDEKLHLVTITKPFYIGKFEVTQSQYVALMGKNPSKFVNPNKPVEYVSYYDAKAYCDKLNSKFLNILPNGYRFDLPTEAQWEYACRAGTTTALNNGKNLTKVDGTCFNVDEVAWYKENSDNTTHEVGQKKPNAWGIYDMPGNVQEWCRDWYGEYPISEVNDPQGLDKGKKKVIRGGCFGLDAGWCRSAHRFWEEYYGRDTWATGFRVALCLLNEALGLKV